MAPFTAIDTDEDGVVDALDLDSDNDCALDAIDDATWRDPTLPAAPNDNCKADAPVCNAGTCAEDSDGDGIPDVVETALGTNPNAADSDGDGISDAIETSANGNSGPFLVVDTDGDGTIDARDVDSSGGSSGTGSSSGSTSSSGGTGSSGTNASGSGGQDPDVDLDEDGLGPDGLTGGSACAASPGSADPASLLGFGLGLVAVLRRSRRRA